MVRKHFLFQLVLLTAFFAQIAYSEKGAAPSGGGTTVRGDGINFTVPGSRSSPAGTPGNRASWPALNPNPSPNPTITTPNINYPSSGIEAQQNKSFLNPNNHPQPVTYSPSESVSPPLNVPQDVANLQATLGDLAAFAEGAWAKEAKINKEAQQNFSETVSNATEKANEEISKIDQQMSECIDNAEIHSEESENDSGESALPMDPDGFDTDDAGLEHSTMLAIADIALGITPVIGTGKDAMEAYSGKSMLTGEALGPVARGFAIAGVILSGVPGAGSKITNQILREGAVGRKAFRASHALLRYGDSFTGIGDDLFYRSPISPGRLHYLDLNRVEIKSITSESENVANTFRSGTYVETLLNKNLTVFRVASSKETLLRGNFFSPLSPNGKAQTTLEFGMIPEFHNLMGVVGEFNIPVGTRVYIGIAAAQTGKYSGSRYLGGGTQIFLDLPRTEIEKFLVKVEPW